MMNVVAGGALAGIGAGVLYAGLGRIAGVGGILHQSLQGDRHHWRYAFLLGMVVAGLCARRGFVDLELSSDVSLAGVLLAGVVAGIGARLANGCTSGHGVCGLGRLSPRSLVVLTVYLVVGAAASLAVRGVI